MEAIYVLFFILGVCFVPLFIGSCVVPWAFNREENNIKKELTEEERQQGRYTKYQYKSIHVGNGVWIREDELKRIM